jgi:hypothetical protein
MPRYFTRDEAHRLLPQAERAVREAVDLKDAYQRADAELRQYTNRIMMLGGVIPNHDEILGLRAGRDEHARRLKHVIDDIHELGCLLKDLDMGLLDFPTLYHGEEVYLCWKLGEEQIEFWHGVNEGYGGRKPIDQEFLANHGGGGEA